VIRTTSGNQSPLDILYETNILRLPERYWRGSPSSSYRQPGALIEAMTPKSREILSSLTSQQAQSQRIEPWELQDESWIRKEETKKMMIEFDRKFNK